MTKNIPIEHLRYYLLPAANPLPEHRQLHDNAYKLWGDVWRETYAQLSLPVSSLEGEFVRQDLIACIAHEDDPLAIHLYSFFSLSSLAARQHPYLARNYPELFFARLAKQGVGEVMSMEYMTVHPDYRKGKSSVHVAVVLGALAMETLKSFGCDAAIAPARRDHKVHEMAHQHGGESVIANVSNHNVACDLVMCHRDRVVEHPSPEVRQLVRKLWDGRAYSQSCRPAVSPDRKAA